MNEPSVGIVRIPYTRPQVSTPGIAPIRSSVSSLKVSMSSGLTSTSAANVASSIRVNAVSVRRAPAIAARAMPPPMPSRSAVTRTNLHPPCRISARNRYKVPPIPRIDVIPPDGIGALQGGSPEASGRLAPVLPVHLGAPGVILRFDLQRRVEEVVAVDQHRPRGVEHDVRVRLLRHH